MWRLYFVVSNTYLRSIFSLGNVIPIVILQPSRRSQTELFHLSSVILRRYFSALYWDRIKIGQYCTGNIHFSIERKQKMQLLPQNWVMDLVRRDRFPFSLVQCMWYRLTILLTDLRVSLIVCPFIFCSVKEPDHFFP